MMLKLQSTENVILPPGLSGCGGMMRIIVCTITCLSGFPAASFTAVILYPPSNS